MQTIEFAFLYYVCLWVMILARPGLKLKVDSFRGLGLNWIFMSTVYLTVTLCQHLADTQVG